MERRPPGAPPLSRVGKPNPARREGQAPQGHPRSRWRGSRGAARPEPAVPGRGARSAPQAASGAQMRPPNPALCAWGLHGAGPAGSRLRLRPSSFWSARDIGEGRTLPAGRSAGTVALVARFGKNKNPKPIVLVSVNARRERKTLFSRQSNPIAHTDHRVKSLPALLLAWLAKRSQDVENILMHATHGHGHMRTNTSFIRCILRRKEKKKARVKNR